MRIEEILTMLFLPFCGFWGILLIVLSLLAPNLAFHGENFLVAVLPLADGPRVVMGAVGSCSKLNNAAPLNCTASSVSPAYDLSVLPPNAPAFLLDAPPAEAFGVVVLGLLFLAVFTVMFAITASHRRSPRIQKAIQAPFWPNVTIIVGVLGFFIGFTTFFILRIYLGKAAQDFNRTVAFQGSDAPQLVAGVGSGFIFAWTGFGFVLAPVVASLIKFQVKAKWNVTK